MTCRVTTGPQEVPGRPRQKGTAAVAAAHQGELNSSDCRLILSTPWHDRLNRLPVWQKAIAPFLAVSVNVDWVEMSLALDLTFTLRVSTLISHALYPSPPPCGSVAFFWRSSLDATVPAYYDCTSLVGKTLMA